MKMVGELRFAVIRSASVIEDFNMDKTKAQIALYKVRKVFEVCLSIMLACATSKLSRIASVRNTGHQLTADGFVCCYSGIR